MVAALDTMVGRVVTALREAQLYNNSIIVFVSDNGATPLQVLYKLQRLFGKETLLAHRQCVCSSSTILTIQHETNYWSTLYFQGGSNWPLRGEKTTVWEGGESLVYWF